MSGIYWTEGAARIKKYGASTSGTKTVIRVELETSDHYEAGAILSAIERAQREQSNVQPPGRPRSASRTRIAAPLLQLTHRPGDED